MLTGQVTPKVNSKDGVGGNNTIMEDDSVSDDDFENPNKTRIKFDDSVMVGVKNKSPNSDDSDIDEIDEIKELTIRTGLNTTTKKKSTSFKL